MLGSILSTKTTDLSTGVLRPPNCCAYVSTSAEERVRRTHKQLEELEDPLVSEDVQSVA